jgi:hypothetical protein
VTAGHANKLITLEHIIQHKAQITFKAIDLHKMENFQMNAHTQITAHIADISRFKCMVG